MNELAEKPQESKNHYLSIRNLRKVYNNAPIPAVDGISFNVEKGKLVDRLGPSCCGKTTTLRMVAGLLKPGGGEIIVANQDMVSVPVHKRGMGMVFQSYALFPHMNVLDNVSFGLQMQGKPKNETNRLAIEALEMVQLPHLAKRKPSELSGGVNSNAWRLRAHWWSNQNSCC